MMIENASTSNLRGIPVEAKTDEPGGDGSGDGSGDAGGDGGGDGAVEGGAVVGRTSWLAIAPWQLLHVHLFAAGTRRILRLVCRLPSDVFV